MIDTVTYVLKTPEGEVYECPTLVTAEAFQLKHGGAIYEVEITYTLVNEIPF